MVERGVRFTLAWLAGIAVGGVLVLIVVFLLLFAAKPAVASDERQIRRDCTWDALRYCKKAIATADRQTIIFCMVSNKDKLQVKCSRHIY